MKEAEKEASPRAEDGAAAAIWAGGVDRKLCGFRVSKATKKEKMQRVDELLKELDLTGAADTMIGSPPTPFMCIPASSHCAAVWFRAAARSSHGTAALVFLQEHGADIMATDQKGNTPLDFALRVQRMERQQRSKAAW